MKKKLMILVVVALFMTLMVSTGCKKKFDITGAWTINYNWFAAANSTSNSDLSSMKGSGAAGTGTIIFTGDKKSGTFSVPAEGYTGTYTVDGKSVRWVYASGTTYVGTSTDDNTMSGTMTSSYLSGTWSATR